MSRGVDSRCAIPALLWRRGFQLATLAGALLLSACAAPRLKPDVTLLRGQDAREQVLAKRDHWTIEGRLAVSDGRGGGSGSLEWTQDGNNYRLSLHAPVTGKTWVIHGDQDHAVLEGLRQQAVEGADAAALLARELGWQVPVAQLGYWVRGMRAPGAARLIFRSDGLPAKIEQDGWNVDYRDYDMDRDPALPSRIFADNGERHVRLAIRHWTLD